MRYLLALSLILSACGGSDPMSDCANVGTEVVPAEKAAIFTYLDCGGYESFAAESAIHPSTNVHSSMARVFINELLEQSLTSGATEHPVGAASVKEIYQANGTTLRGWAAMVKVEETGAGGAWYWYENYNPRSGDSPIAASKGSSVCVPCHSAGKDFFLTPFPLE